MKTLTSVLIFFSQAHAIAGITSMDFIPSGVDQIVINPSSVDTYAVWGGTAFSGELATVFGGSSNLFSNELINYSSGNSLFPRGPDQLPQWNYLITGVDQVYGGLGHQYADGFPVSGEGFGLNFYPDASLNTNYELYLSSYNGTTQVKAINILGETVQTLNLSPFDYGRLLISASGEPFTVTMRLVSGSTGVDGSSVFIGSSTATIAPVSEPRSWLTLIVLIPTLMVARRMSHARTSSLPAWRPA